MGKIKMWSNKYHCFVATLNGLLYSEDNGHTWNSLYKYDHINIEIYRKRKDKTN